MLQDAWGENEDDHDLNDRDEGGNPLGNEGRRNKHPKSSRSRGSKCSKQSGRGHSKHSRKRKECLINNLNLRTDRLAAVMNVDQNSQSQGSRMTAGSRTNRTNNQELMSQRDRDYQGHVQHAVPALNQGSKQGAQALHPGTLPSPHSGLANLAPPVDHNIISSFDQIEEARFEVADFKKNLLSLIAFFDDLTGSIQALDLTA